ncbi:Importin alpha subunit (Karyopherin alpha subunit) (Serine-rich RNA polymerase I suppressor protein) [Tulasnella sp. UAMH 9824]|nr:Importin alpha subunit (Karyopherin alpha subunit) (Serine-rich RNA polymerase I suppressor protein) [Tulasnella sp. UAMH 9824]
MSPILLKITKEPAQGRDGSVEEDESALDSYITEDSLIAPDIIDGLRSNDQTARLEAATKLHRLVDKRGITSVQAIINSGLIPDIVAMISLDDVKLQVPLSFVLGFLTAGSSENISAVLLSERVIREGGLKPPLDILGNPSKQKENNNYAAASAIAGITNQLSPDVAAYSLHIREIVTILAKYIEYQQDETAGSLEASLLALSYISSNAPAIDTVLDGGIIPRIVQLCFSKQASARHGALQCVGYILYSDDGTTQLIKAGVLEALKACISSEDAQNRRLACWAASGIAAGTLDQAKALITAGFIPMLINVISDSEEPAETGSDAAWALAGLVCKWKNYDQDVRETLLEENCLEGLLLALRLKDQSAVAISMKGILRFVKHGGPGNQRL